MKISLVSVTVSDPIEAHKFYTEVLGFTTRMFMPEMFLAIVASPEDPNGTGLLLEPSDNPAAKTFQVEIKRQQLPVIVFGVEDVQQEYEKLKARGVVFIKPPTKTDFGTEAVFDDTCGNYIQIYHP